mmetsp:Transcript_19038/g.55248  ORF Transcript_19038/g.55248 Transcript_19038/m.55248 type:complete len:218 (-) Transcript_19038:1134-1787(-)
MHWATGRQRTMAAQLIHPLEQQLCLVGQRLQVQTARGPLHAQQGVHEEVKVDRGLVPRLLQHPEQQARILDVEPHDLQHGLYRLVAHHRAELAPSDITSPVAVEPGQDLAQLGGVPHVYLPLLHGLRHAVRLRHLHRGLDVDARHDVHERDLGKKDHEDEQCGVDAIHVGEHLELLSPIRAPRGCLVVGQHCRHQTAEVLPDTLPKAGIFVDAHLRR